MPELGGWVPAVDRAPADTDLLSEWAPRAERGRHRTVEPDLADPEADWWAEPDDASAGPSWLESPADAGPESDGDPLAGAVPLDDPWDAGGPPAGSGPIDAGVPEPLADEDESEPGRARGHRINGRWGRFAELWVPESMREVRVDPGRRGMIVLVLVAAVAAVVAAVGVWRDRPEPRPIETSVVAGAPDSVAIVSPSPAAVAVASGTASPTLAPTEILVSVTGLVASPGVVRLPPDARVTDAIAAAGGTQPGANLTGMNLAAKLADGDSVVVTDSPSAAANPGSASGASTGGAAGGSSGPAGGLVNLNTADEAALDTLPGVGPVMAQNILAWRETNGTFTSVEQLQEISGIGPSRYAQLAQLVTVG